MATRSQRSKRPVTIVELPEFEEAAKKVFDAHTLRALYLLLAENPLAGSGVPGYPGLLEVRFANVRVLYAIGGGFANIYLLAILDGEEPLPPASSEDGKLLRKTLDAFLKGGLILGAREALRALWEVVRDHF